MWKEVNSVRRKREQIGVFVRRAEEEVVTGKEDKKKRWSEYVERLVNVPDDRDADAVCLERGGKWNERVTVNSIMKREGTESLM